SLAAGRRHQYQRLNTYAYFGPVAGLVVEPRGNIVGEKLRMANKNSLTVAAKIGTGADYKFPGFFIGGEIGYMYNFKKIEGNPIQFLTIMVGLKSDITRLSEKVTEVIGIDTYKDCVMYGIYKFKRIGHILRVLSKHGLAEVVSRSNIDRIIPDSFLLWNTHTRRIFEDDFNVRVRAAIEELGPTFIKLGQLLSNRADIVPRDLRQELVRLQDDVPTDAIDIRAKLRTAFDIDVDAHFSHIDEEPLAAAS